MPVAMDEMIAALKHLEAVETDDGSPNGAPFTWEILIVDDGSKDRTAAVAQGLVEREGSDRVRLLKQARNTGKGGAVRKGMLRTRGRYLLMADADGATRAADLGTLLARLRAHESAEGLGAAIGSRAHMTGAAAAPSPPSNGGAAEGDMGGVAAAAPARTVQRSALRRFLMWGFHTFVGLLAGGSGIKDTQVSAHVGERFVFFTAVAVLSLGDVGLPHAAIQRPRSLPFPVCVYPCSTDCSVASSCSAGPPPACSSPSSTSSAGPSTWSWCTWPRARACPSW